MAAAAATSAAAITASATGMSDWYRIKSGPAKVELGPWRGCAESNGFRVCAKTETLPNASAWRASQALSVIVPVLAAATAASAGASKKRVSMGMAAITMVVLIITMVVWNVAGRSSFKKAESISPDVDGETGIAFTAMYGTSIVLLGIAAFLSR